MIGLEEQTVELQVDVPVAKFTKNILPWQYTVFRAFDQKLAQFFMNELHRRARKTSFGLNVLIAEAVTHPDRPYFYMGPTYKQAKKTVWLDPNMLFSFLPDRDEFGWEKNESELYIRFCNGAMLHILGGDDPDSLRGPDWEGGVLDEWALMKQNIFFEILRPVITQDPLRWLMFNYTTKPDSHATAMFDKYGCIKTPADLPACGPTKERMPGWFCMRLDAEVSKILPAVELAKAKAEMPGWLYDQEFRCARVTSEERALITSILMESLEHVHIPELETKKIISIDPAEGRIKSRAVDEETLGQQGDEIVLKYFENTEVVEQQILSRPAISDNIMILSGYAKNMAMAHKCRNFIVDSIGIGKGVADDLRLEKDDDDKPKFHVQLFKGNEKSSEPERFKDKNMEAVWLTSRQMRNGRVEPIEDDETRRQLTKLRCQANRVGQLQLDPSEKIKEACGCSPDRAKCYVMGIYGLQNVKPEVAKRRDGYKKRKKRSWQAA
jgi:hypothetical protein